MRSKLVVVIGILVVRTVVLVVFPRELMVWGIVVAKTLMFTVPVAMDCKEVKIMLMFSVVLMTVVVVVEVGVVGGWMAVWVIMVVDWVVVSLRPDVIFLESLLLLS